MAEGGMFTSRHSSWGGVSFSDDGTTATDAIDVLWPNIDDHDPGRGTTDVSVKGSVRSQHRDLGEKGRIVWLVFPHYARALFDALAAKMDGPNGDLSRALALYHRSGTYTAQAKPFRPKPLYSAGGAHRWIADHGRLLNLKLIVTGSAAWSAPDPFA
jgi:hypothetical protein